ncbi:IucA/IucC family C-terminal-domain containing protein [Alteribacter populi]|uniref:IucA/IucC family C-terminal-domain containing protein n=1 Tax=Alteribacter populi TaxID=2011011 RepID=UPI000BBAAD06|nr:IucA/IucC family C-terminal-domain containing protein [Alteribacter populi]
MIDQQASLNLSQYKGLMVGDAFLHNMDFVVEDLIASPSHVENLISILCEQMDTKNRVIAGTIFGKKYSVLAMNLFKAIIEQGTILDAHPSQVGLKPDKKGSMQFIFKESTVHSISSLSIRQVQMMIYTFIDTHLQPLFEAIAAKSGSKVTHMLSLVAHNLYQTSKKLKLEHPEKVEEIDTYFALFISDKLFVHGKPNPLSFEFDLYDPENGDDSYYVRKHCCLSYLRYDGDKARCCGTCPFIDRTKKKNG